MAYTKENARIVYMGTPEISATVLQGLIESGFHIVGVVTNPDKPMGRKGILTPSPVKMLAQCFGIPVFQPVKIRLENDFLKDLNPDVIVTMAYGQIVPEAVLSCPRKGCINLHGSLLPALRGAAPIQRAIDLGLKETGVTLMEMVKAMDAGAMYDTAIVPIEENDNYSTLANKIGVAARELIVKDLLPYLNDELPGTPQEESLVTFANKILPEDEKLDLSWPASRLLCRIKALSLTPGGYVYLGEEKLKIFSAHIVSGSDAAPGTVTKAHKGFEVATGEGTLSLDLVQLQGKKTMDGKSFVNGYRDLEGKVLS